MRKELQDKYIIQKVSWDLIKFEYGGYTILHCGSLISICERKSKKIDPNIVDDIKVPNWVEDVLTLFLEYGWDLTDHLPDNIEYFIPELEKVGFKILSLRT